MEESFVRALREARDRQGERRYRVATAEDGGLDALFADVAAEEAALVGCGFAPLGVVIDQGPDDRGELDVVRVLVDRDGTTVAGFLTSTSAETRRAVRLQLASHLGGEMWLTQRSMQLGLATPPFVHRHHVADGVAVADLVAAHRGFAGAAGPLERIAALEELAVTLTALRERTLRWRAEQPADELLDADLRAALGAQYARLGSRIARRLRDELPTARLRRG
jgi:hypothetical protein